MLVSKRYYGNPGAISIIDAALVFQKVIAVHRSGVQFNPVDGVPFDREVHYDPTRGLLIFSADNPFSGPTFGRPNRQFLEQVVVIYKNLW